VLDLSETVPYVGGAAAQASGRTGAGVKVAVLDSGIDYTHRNLGGAGTAAAYAAAYGTSTSDPKNTTLDGLFPTAKVVAGYDFVGEDWPNSPEKPDPDPIDLEGHGTHVADIIAGKSLDGTHKGMAPNASLVAVKVCSAVATSCSGVALLQGMDFALDPNGDGNIEDAVDVINMSLGSSYGQIEDDLTLAATNAVKLGVVVVVSAGNSANRPYIVGSPSTGLGVISVAQTQTPSATAVPLVVNAPAAIAGVYTNTQTLDFAPIGAGVTGDVAFYGRGCPAGSVAAGSPADPVVTNPAGKIALIDRGGCAVSLKVDKAVSEGATGVLIGLVAGGDAVAFSFGGGTNFKPSLVIQQSLSNAIKGQLATGVVNVSISNAAAVPLIGGIVASSSRGPSISLQHIKPEIGAPGASVSAEAGTGTGETAFGGTSGAAPMVSGAAALLVEAFPKYSPDRIKALLMNSAETVIFTNQALLPGELAPITRVGAGELRVDRALALTSLAWNQAQKSASLSFGAIEVDRTITTTDQRLRIENKSSSTKTYTITPTFRYADDQASGAVKLVLNSSVSVPANGYKDVDVRLIIDPDKLPVWTLDGGPQGGDGAGLNRPEYDGYITLTASAEKLSVPWHVLPRRAAATESQWISKKGSNLALYLNNTGHADGEFDVFSLTGTSAKLPRTELPRPGDNFAVVDLRATGVRYLAPGIYSPTSDYLEFAINTHGRRAHPNHPAEFDVYIDTNNDGVDDFVAFNTEVGGFAATGQNSVLIVNLATGAAVAQLYTDADLNSGNTIFTVPMAAIGLTPGKTIKFSVYAFDNYFSGNLTDAIENMLFTPGAARFNPAVQIGTVVTKTGGRLDVSRANVANTKSSESGVLIMHRRAAKQEADVLVAN
jgi:subtilisin family serine protease